MATPAPTDELVMSNEEIQATLTNEEPDSDLEALDPEPDNLDSAADPDDDGRRPWETPDEGTEADAETNTPVSRKGSKAVRQIKANGKVHQVDMSDSAGVDKLLELGLGARAVFTERDTLKKAAAKHATDLAEAKKYKDLWDKLEASKSNHDELYEKVFGKPFAAAAKERSEADDRYAAASPEERRIIDHQRKMEQDARAAAEAAKRTEAESAKLKDRESQLDLRELRNQMTPDFYKLEFSSRVKNEEHAAKLNKALWRMTVGDIKEQYGNLANVSEIPAGEVKRIMRENHDILWANHKQTAEAEVKSTIDKKKAAARQQAQQASTRNYSDGQTQSKDLQALAKDPVKLMRKMFGRR